MSFSVIKDNKYLFEIFFDEGQRPIYRQRTLVKDGKTIIDETFTTHYRPWGAVFLKGTKEG